MSELFNTTSWTMIVEASGTGAGAGESLVALESLCVRYWEPLYAYARGCGKSHADAEDATQSFFAHLLATNLPGRASPERGRFRSFLLSSMRNFMSVEHRNATTEKRGGQAGPHLPIEMAHGVAAQVAGTGSPEDAYDRKWAHTLLQIALDQLAQEQAAAGNAERFELLRPLLLDPAQATCVREQLISRLDMTEVGIRTALSRLRARFRDIVRKEVSRLVADPAEVDEEIAHLLRALS